MTTKIRTRPFDAAAYLDHPEVIAAFIDAALEDGDAGDIAEALGVVARAHGMTAIAKATGLKREALYRALSQDGNPELDTLVRVMKALRLNLKVTPASVAE